jgi:phenylalanyl-tRNA synthetase alpha chain
MKELLENIKTQALADIEKAPTPEALYQIQVKYLGRKGELTLLMQNIADLPKEEKPLVGKMCNEIKTALEDAFAKRKEALEAGEISRRLTEAWVDVTAPGTHYEIGHMHPVSQVQFEVEQIWSDMGFTIEDGPEVESEYYNFEGLNIPSHHPARDMQDTFFVKGDADKKHGRLVLRTHTSPVQVRTMEKYGAPLRVIVPGRVFRNEATDARHEHTFNQVEGLMVDADISLAHLKGVMQEFLTRLFGREMKVRFRPGYFPFVEPGLELDISCTLCKVAPTSRRGINEVASLWLGLVEDG